MAPRPGRRPLAPRGRAGAAVAQADARHRPQPATSSADLVRSHRRPRRAVARAARAAARHRGAGARPAAPALDLPPQGGRPDRVGRPPAAGGRAKAALVEVQYDEYGAGDPNRLHHAPLRRGPGGVRAEPPSAAPTSTTPPPEVLEQNNAMSLFGLHRRLRGAAARPLRRVRGDQLAALAADGAGLRAARPAAGAWSTTTTSTSRPTRCTSSWPCATSAARWSADEPDLADDVFLGAFTCLDLEDRVAGRVAGALGRSA